MQTKVFHGEIKEIYVTLFREGFAGSWAGGDVRPRIAYTVRRFHHTFTTGNPRMLTIHIVQARLGYGSDYIKFADQEGLVLYLLTRGVTDDNIVKALAGLVRHGAYTIQQEACTPGTEGVV